MFLLDLPMLGLLLPFPEVFQRKTGIPSCPYGQVRKLPLFYGTGWKTYLVSLPVGPIKRNWSGNLKTISQSPASFRFLLNAWELSLPLLHADVGASVYLAGMSECNTSKPSSLCASEKLVRGLIQMLSKKKVNLQERNKSESQKSCLAWENLIRTVSFCCDRI